LQKLNGKVAVITGAASGIGKAVAELFAKEGCKVVCCTSKKLEAGQAVVDEINKAGFTGIFVPADVAKIEDLENLVSRAINEYGKIDILINNAGVNGNPGYPIHEFDEELFKKVIDVNLLSIMRLSKLVIPYMIRQGKGAIVNTCSPAGKAGIPFSSIYSASKGGVYTLTKSMALDCVEHGIRVNMVIPGLTKTGMVPEGAEMNEYYLAGIPMKRMADPEEIAPAFLYLASDESSFCTGTALCVDGGESCKG
jgi:Dehydrogenases with different specificities (related to short-chain alcohol dehydrogenases)